MIASYSPEFNDCIIRTRSSVVVGWNSDRSAGSPFAMRCAAHGRRFLLDQREARFERRSRQGAVGSSVGAGPAGGADAAPNPLCVAGGDGSAVAAAVRYCARSSTISARRSGLRLVASRSESASVRELASVWASPLKTGAGTGPPSRPRNLAIKTGAKVFSVAGHCPQLVKSLPALNPLELLEVDLRATFVPCGLSFLLPSGFRLLCLEILRDLILEALYHRILLLLSSPYRIRKRTHHCEQSLLILFRVAHGHAREPLR